MKITKIENGIQIDFDTPVKIEKIGEEEITLSDGTTIQSHHDGDCCEHHWADFSTLEINPDHSLPFTTLTLKKVDGMGFLMNKMLINCYGNNNGWYSSNLDLIIDNGPLNYIWDISECQEISG